MSCRDFLNSGVVFIDSFSISANEKHATCSAFIIHVTLLKRVKMFSNMKQKCLKLHSDVQTLTSL